MFGPFTRDESKMDSVAQAVVKMREKPKIEQLDELSKKTLKSYVKKSLNPYKTDREHESAWMRGDKAGVAKAEKKMGNRWKGRTLATKKISEK